MKIIFAIIFILTSTSFAQVNISYEEKQQKIKKLRENVCLDESSKEASKTEAVGACPECIETAKKEDPSKTKINVAPKDNKEQELAFYRLLKAKLGTGEKASLCMTISQCESMLKQYQDQAEQYKKAQEQAKKQLESSLEEFEKFLSSDMTTTPVPGPLVNMNGYNQHHPQVYQVISNIYTNTPDQATKIKVQQMYTNWTNGNGKYILDPDLVASFIAEEKKLKTTTAANQNGYYNYGYSGYGYGNTTTMDYYIQQIKGIIEGLKDEDKEKQKQKGMAVDGNEFQKYVEKAEYKIQSVQNKQGFRRCNLSPAEIFALIDYSGDGYIALNAALRAGGDKAAQYESYKNVLNSALGKLRKHDDFVDRGTTLPYEVEQQYQVGAIIDSPAFTSTSAFGGFSGKHKFTIKSKTGVYIAPFALSDSEEEVLFPAGAKFKILERKTESNGYIRFVMEEVDP